MGLGVQFRQFMAQNFEGLDCLPDNDLSQLEMQNAVEEFFGDKKEDIKEYSLFCDSSK